MTHGRAPRKPRWLKTGNTLQLARSRASMPTQQTLDAIIDTLKGCFAALRTATVSEMQFAVLKGAISTATAIERQGVVKGLTRVTQEADAALDEVWNRITRHGRWQPTGLHYQELVAISDFVNLHIWQIRQLSHGEYLAAIRTGVGLMGATGIVISDLDQMADLAGTTPSQRQAA